MKARYLRVLDALGVSLLLSYVITLSPTSTLLVANGRIHSNITYTVCPVAVPCSIDRFFPHPLLDTYSRVTLGTYLAISPASTGHVWVFAPHLQTS